MKKIFASLLLALFFSVPVHAEPQIPAYRAAFYVGQNVMACGIVKQVHNGRSAVYLNLDKEFPNQTLGIVIWNDNLDAFQTRFGNLDVFVNRRACVRGEIKEFNNSLQIQVRNPQFLRLMNN